MMRRVLALIMTFFVLPFELLTAFRLSPALTTINQIERRHSFIERFPIESPYSSLSPKKREHSLLMSSDEGEQDLSPTLEVLGAVGLGAQPIVWVSLFFVATTGAGLPAGPFGLLGALEGISYLIVVGLFASSALGNFEDSGSPSNDLLTRAKRVSLTTIIAALLTFASLVVNQGCIPNAKPLLDYSSYLPVCKAEDTPGIFGL